MYKFTLKELLKDVLTEGAFRLLNQSKNITLTISWDQHTHNLDYILADSNLCKISFDIYTITLKAPKSGWYHIAHTTRDNVLFREENATKYVGMVQISDASTFDTLTNYINAINICYENDAELLSNFYHLLHRVEEDSYTKEKTIIWNSYTQTPNLTINSMYEFGQEVSCENNNKITITLLLRKNNTIAILEYGGGKFYPEINPRRISNIYFLLENDSVIIFSPNHKTGTFNGSHEGKWTWELSAEIIELFSSNKIKSIRIESNTESYNIDEIHLINKLCLREYFRHYKEILNECGIQLTHVPTEVNIENKKNKDSCYVYMMKDEVNGYHKIGISKNPNYRERTLQSEKPTIRLIAAKEYPIRSIAEAIEMALHKTYETKRLRGEWFDLTDEDIDILKQVLS